MVEVTPGGSLTYNYLGRRLAGDEFDTVVAIATQVGQLRRGDLRLRRPDLDGRLVRQFHLAPGSAGRFLPVHLRTSHAANDTLNLFPGLGHLSGHGRGLPTAPSTPGSTPAAGSSSTIRDHGHTELIDPDNSGLQGRSIIDLVVHPDGPLIILHDWAMTQKVEILVDPDNWSERRQLGAAAHGPGPGSRPGGLDAVVESRDVIWFAVEGRGPGALGHQRSGRRPQRSLTWFDESDDVWYEPVTSFPGTSLDPGTDPGPGRGPGRTLWAGGNGLVQFTYDLAGQDLGRRDGPAGLCRKSRSPTTRAWSTAT